MAAKNLTAPHAAFSQQLDEDARCKLERSSWNPPILSTPFEQRRLRILQGLFAGLARVECTAKTQGKDIRDITISVGNQHVRITLDRQGARQQNSRSRSAEELDDFLELAILNSCRREEVWKSWQDNPSAAIERQLTEIATEIVVSGDGLVDACVMRSVARARLKFEMAS